MMSERVGDSLSGRPFVFQEVKERRSERRAKVCLCYPERRSFSSEVQRAIASGAVVCCASSYLSSLPSGRAGGRPPLYALQGKCKANAEPSSLELC